MTDTENGSEEHYDSIEEQAVAWLVRLRRDNAKTEPAELTAWLTQSPDHRSAYDWAKRHFSASEVLKVSKRHGLRRTFGTHSWRAKPAVAAAIAAAVALSATFWLNRPMGGSSQQADAPRLLQTLPGQISAVDLAEGTKVTMDAGSHLDIVNGDERRLQFQQGRARIAVKSDGRPLTVIAGEGEIFTRTALFDVSRSMDDRIEIAVLSGEVELRDLLRPATLHTYSRHVRAGQAVTYPARKFRPEPLRRQGIDRRDWPLGWTEYSSIPLRTLIDDANRYASPPIRLDDPTLGALLVSGRFRLTESDRFSTRIAELFDLTLVRRSNAIHLRPRQKNGGAAKVGRFSASTTPPEPAEAAGQ